MWNAPSVWALSSCFNPLRLRISSGTFCPKSNLPIGVKEIGGHQWKKVLKLDLEHSVPESSKECLIIVLWYPQTNKKTSTHVSSGAFKIFQKFLINAQTAFKNLWKLRNTLFSEQIVQSNSSPFFLLQWVKYLSSFGDNVCQEWLVCAGSL